MNQSSLLELAGFQSAFIVKPSSLGDIVHTLPVVHLLKKAYPHLHFRWVCNPEWMPLLEDNADLDEVIPFPRKEFRGAPGMAGFVGWARKLNKAARELPEVALDFQGLLRSALICQARGCSAVIGLSDAREGATLLYRHTIPVNAASHAVDRYLEMARGLGVEVTPDRLPVPLPQGTAPQHGALPSRYFLLHPYARGAGKSLSDECIQALCDCLGPHPVIIAGRSDHTFEPRGPHVLSLLNQTSLSELIWLIRNARATVSVDSGPMHIAAAITDRTLGIHTWSDPRKVGPYPLSVKAWKAGRIASRLEFNDSEANTSRQLETPDARRVADYVLQQWA
jgi:heptosyltransferase I